MPSGAVFITCLIAVALLAVWAVRRARGFWHAAFSGTPAPALLVHRDGRVLAANPSFLRWSRLAKSADVRSLLTNSRRSGTANPDLDEALDSVLRAAATGRSWHGELSLRIGDEQVRAAAWLTRVPHNRSSVLQFEVPYHRPPQPEITVPSAAFRMIADDATEGILVLKDDRIAYANASAARMFGFDAPAEMRDTGFSEMIAPASRSLFSASVLDRGTGVQAFARTEVRGLTRHGRTADLEMSAWVIDWGPGKALAVFARDVTDRKTLEREQALWHWEQEAFSEIDRNIVGVADLNTILDSILQHAVNLVRADWSAVMTIDAGVNEAVWRMIRGGTTAQQAAFPLEADLKSLLSLADGQIVHDDSLSKPHVVARLMEQEQLRTTVWSSLRVEGEVSGSLVVGYRSQRSPQRREQRLLASLAEKTSIAMMNARRYERVLERERDLEKLSISRVEAQEEERRRIAKEIHDGIGQMLTAIKFNLEILEDSIGEGTEAAARVTDMKGVLDNLMKEAREMSYALMPSVLEDFGLAPALQMLCEQFGAKHEIRTMFQNHGLNRRLRRMLEISLYRIAQDVLANVARHAAASEVTVQVICSADRIRLVVEDNGKGIAATGAQPAGVGFVSVRERAAQFSGTLTVDSSPGEGTVVSVEVPLVDEDRT